MYEYVILLEVIHVTSIMKRLFILIITTSLFLGAISISNAQQDNRDAIELELIQQVQDPTTLEFEYTLRVRSLVDTSRMRINWEITRGLMKETKGTVMSDNPDVVKNQDIFITKKFLPLKAGFEKLRVTAIAYAPPPQNDYFSSKEIEFLINENLEIAPNRSEYITAKNLRTFLDIIKVVGAGFVVFAITVLAYTRFRQWLDRE